MKSRQEPVLCKVTIFFFGNKKEASISTLTVLEYYIHVGVWHTHRGTFYKTWKWQPVLILPRTYLNGNTFQAISGLSKSCSVLKFTLSLERRWKNTDDEQYWDYLLTEISCFVNCKECCPSATMLSRLVYKYFLINVQCNTGCVCFLLLLNAFLTIGRFTWLV